MKYCQGCGVELQTTDENKLGYIPPAALETDHAVCRRCYRLTHYNEVAPVEINADDFLHILHKIGDRRGLVVKIVDLFDFNGSWISGLSRIVGHNPILLVANKIDLFPQNIHLNKLKNWLQHSAKEMGLKPVEILFCSAEKGTGVERVMKAMEMYRQGKDVYVVGTTNVGKSTLINQILKKFQVDDKELLTTSRFPGTTLDLIEIPLQGGSHLYDTPGVINQQQMAHYVTEQELKVITPMKPIKPRVYQLNEQQTLFFGGLARVDFVRGAHQSFVCYLSNLLKVHRTKLEKADDLYEQHVGELLSPPSNESFTRWPRLVKHTFKIPAEPTDIVMPGLGWVSIKGSGGLIEAFAPEGVHVSLRPALI